MTQTSFLLSGLSNSKAPMGEGKAVLSADVSESGGEGFLAQLAQLVAGEADSAELPTEDIEGVDGEVVSKQALSDELLTALSDGQGGEESAISELGAADLVRAQSASDALLNSDEADASTLAAKKDGEALLQRLNESSQALATKATAATNGDAGKDLPSGGLQEGSNKASERDGEAQLLSEAGTLEGQALTSAADKVQLDENGLERNALSSTLAESEAEHELTLSDGDMTLLKKRSGSESENTVSGDVLQTGAVTDTPTLASTANPGEAQDVGLHLAGATTAAPLQSGDDELSPEMAKANANPELSNRAQREAMMRMQAAVMPQDSTAEESSLTNSMSDLHGRAGNTQPQSTMSQTASAVQAAVTPQAGTPLSAFNAIPWTPAAMQTANGEPQSAASQAMLEAAAAQSLTETSRAGGESKADHLAQQLASSFGQQGGTTTAAKLDTAVAQTPLQMSQNQAQAAEALSERVNMMMSKNLKHVDIRLDPPELGRMQIKLSMNQDQANVQFTVSNQAAREMVEQTMPRLREMMQQHGLQLAQSSVQQQDGGGRQAFGGQQTQQGDGHGSQSGGGDSSRGWGENEQDAERLGVNHELYVNASKDRVDYYA